MKKNLLAIGILATSFPFSAQILTYVGDGASVYVQQEALVYSGGTVQTVGAGKIDNSGNVMIDQGGFYTKAADGTTDKTDGQNFILRLNSTAAPYTPYGQLFITGATQSQITGIVDKEYRNSNQGAYQQMGFPFYGKTASSLSAELGKTFSDSRWSENEILNWNNRKVRSDVFPLASKFGVTQPAYSYFMVGAKGMDVQAAVKTIKGVPFSDEAANTQVQLADAGLGINFGTGGAARNYFGEKYNTYVQDAFEIAKGGTAWVGQFGKNMYQFGNPFLTNLDLSNIGLPETAAINDGLDIESLYGIRVDADAASVDFNITDGSSGGGATNYVTFNSGVPTGDVNYLVVKPLSAFVIKLNDNAEKPKFDFKNLRRFKYTARNPSTNYNVTAAKRMGANMLASSKQYANNATMKTGSTVKQLGIYALDAAGKVVDKTYYVVYNNAITGQPTETSKSIQVAAGAQNLIGTFEEKAAGGIDSSLENTYWLYINEANENEFKGKEVPLRLFDDNKVVKSLKFEIRENAQLVSEGVSSLTSGESFYFQNPDGTPQVIKQNQIVPVSSSNIGLFYGNPITTVLADNPAVQKPSSTIVVLDNSDNSYKVLFDKNWSKANVTVYDISGKLISEKNDIDTSNNYTIQLPSKNTVYVVTAVSEKGEKFVQKIKN